MHKCNSNGSQSDREFTFSCDSRRKAKVKAVFFLENGSEKILEQSAVERNYAKHNVFLGKPSLAYGWSAGNLNRPIRIQQAGKILVS